MERCLLSIDWDYFIYTKEYDLGSCIENNRSLIDLWYKRYIQEKARGKDIHDSFHISSELDAFWEKIRERFRFAGGVKSCVSDSHALSYDIALENDCNMVCLFDAHADLGYGGLSALNFEVNCSNWLGKLLKDKHIDKACIIYSPYTAEKPEHFRQMNNIFNVRYSDFNGLDKDIMVTAIHICRSGAWTPPWLDDRFSQFVDALGIPYETVRCPERKWDTESLSFADQIDYLMA